MDRKTSGPPASHPLARVEVDQYQTLLDMHDRTLEDRAPEDEEDPELRRKLAAWRTELVERVGMDRRPLQEP